ncbi:MAG: peroxiredoxin [Candidatus Pacebacteria bacterium]|nr:peroxiredoxin [Candidatus Paceibacterota bacterium]MBP9772308.1 peroxiredoxin [Candidatus Paceibacterota bacterium]
MIETNTLAPDFSLPDENGEFHSLEEYRGSWVLLYFYPKDDTPGCTKEACSLRDHALDYEQNDLIVVGISKDSGESHQKFISKYKLPFTLLSDEKEKVINIYGAGGALGTKRISYLIDPEGMVEKVYPKVDPENHAGEVLKDLESLR